MAIDNAMLFEEERRTALAFQTSLLPQALPALDGLEVACRYVPAKPLVTHGQGIQTQVGGDWYDIIPLSAGRVGIVIGDVEGRGRPCGGDHGPAPRRAARVRPGRQAARGDPAQARRLVPDAQPAAPDKPGSLGADPPIVSCTYLVYDAWSRTLSFANAGHDAPLLITERRGRPDGDRAQGRAARRAGQGNARMPTYLEETHELAAGDTLVLYTDGLTDRRHRADGHGHYTEAEALQMLREAVDAGRTGTSRQIAQAAERAVPGEIDDDMAIVVVRTSPVDLASWDCTFPAEPIRVSEARRAGRGHVPVLGDGPRAGRADLPAGVGGGDQRRAARGGLADPEARVRFRAIRDGDSGDHRGLVRVTVRRPPDRAAGKEFTLRLRRGSAAVWVEVFDADLRLPRIRSAGETDEGGRGLYLVDQLATRWGSRPTQDGKAVWFEMPMKEGSGRQLTAS